MDNEPTSSESKAVEQRPVESLKELIELIELNDIQFEEVSAVRAPEANEFANLDDEIEIKFDITEARQDSMLLVRVAANVMLETSIVRATAAASYRLSEEREVPSPLFADFIENVAFFTVYPYLRSSIQSLAAIIGERKVILPMIRVGQIALKRE